MEIMVPPNPFDWLENCPHCHMPMMKVMLTRERIKLEPSTINGGEPYPSWFYDWSQTQEFISGAAVQQPRDNGPLAFPTWYCVGCINVWVVFRGLWFRTSFAPALPQGIVNAGPTEAPALRQ